MQTTEAPHEKPLKEERLQVMVEPEFRRELAAEIEAANAEGDDVTLSALTRRLLRQWMLTRRSARAAK